MRRRRRGLALALLAVLLVLAGGTMALRAAFRSPGVVTLSGHVSGWASQMGLDAAPMGFDARTYRAFFITGAATAFQPPPHGAATYLDTVDTVTGALVRSVRLGPAPFGLAIDEQTNRIFVADTADKTVRMFDARDGAFLRTISISPLAASDLAIDARTGRVFVASTLYNSVVTLDARTGALLRTVHDVGDVLTVDEQTERVFAFIANNGSATNAVAVLDARSGALLRSVPVNGAPMQIAATTANGIVSVTGYTSTLLLDVQTGRVLHTILTGFPQRVAGAVGGRLLLTDYYVGLNGQHLSLVDPRTGQMTRIPVSGVDDASQMAVDGRRGRVFAFDGSPDGSGTVWTIDVRSGAVLHTEAIAGSPAAIAIDERAGRVFVAVGSIDRTGAPIGPSDVIVLDARSGRVLRTVPLAAPPTALLVDEQAGHVAVVMGGGATQTSDAWGWIPPSLRRWLPFLPASHPSTRVSPSTVRLLDATH